MSDDLVRQPALRRWQEGVYGNGPYQVPDYESMAAIVQEHEQMAVRIEELEAKLAKVVEVLERIEDASRYFGSNPESSETTVRYAHETTRRLCSTTLAELKGKTDD